MSDKLKPCPFCGGEAKAYADNHKKVMLHCEKCKLYFGIELEIGCELEEGWKATINSKEDAIKIWNTRKPMDRIIGKLIDEIANPDKNYRAGIHKAIEIVKGDDENE